MINKPQPDEYAPFYGNYVKMVEEGKDILSLLEELKESTYSLLSEVSEEKAAKSYQPGKWTLKELVGHMIDAERTFAFRAFCFSREHIELPGFDQDVYIQNANFNDHSIKELAAEFRTTRESNLYFVRSLTDDQLKKTGVASGNPVSVRALVSILAGHELHHVRIIKERYLI